MNQIDKDIDFAQNKILDVKCNQCGSQEFLPMHDCPYKSEIHNNDEECNCCKTCINLCCDEI